MACPSRWRPQLYWIGSFFSNFLPTGIGGDAVRLMLTPVPRGGCKGAARILVGGLSGLLAMMLSMLAILILPLELGGAGDVNATGGAGGVGGTITGTFNGQITSDFAETTGSIALAVGATGGGGEGSRGGDQTANAGTGGQGGTINGFAIGSSITSACGAEIAASGGAGGDGPKDGSALQDSMGGNGGGDNGVTLTGVQNTGSITGLGGDGILALALGGSGGNGGTPISADARASGSGGTGGDGGAAAGALADARGGDANGGHGGDGGRGGHGGSATTIGAGGNVENGGQATSGNGDASANGERGGDGGDGPYAEGGAGGSGAEGGIGGTGGTGGSGGDGGAATGALADARGGDANGGHGGVGGRGGRGGVGGSATAIGDGGDGGDGGNGGQATSGNGDASANGGHGGGGGRGGSGGSGGSGSGGSGGDGGHASATFNGEVGSGIRPVTRIGLRVTADGGDGGAGGTASSGSSIGAGGDGGTGGEVTTVNNAVIMTLNELAHGMLARSVGGDGGRGGHSELSAVSFAGDDYIALSSITIGGKGGTGGNGGTVNVENNGIVRTIGARSHGMFAESMGGRGGSGGAAGSISNNTTTRASLIPEGSGGDGNTVMVTNGAGASITTTGLAANGIVAQSIGGGGSQSGDGGWVTVTNSGTIATGGKNAKGILAQSIGGGADGSGGEVAVNLFSSAAVQTSGAKAPAIFAQSISGGSGQVTASSGEFTGSVRGIGSGGPVNVNVGTDGSAVVVNAKGTGSAGIHAHIAGDTTGAINMQIGKAAFVAGGQSTLSGGADAAGIFMDGGVGNVIGNAGSITSQAGVDGTAFNSNSTSSTSLTNTGTIVGSQIFTGGAMLANLRGGTLVTGRTLQLGTAGTIANGGTIEPGGRRQLLTTVLTGNLDQSGSGRLILDSDHVRGRSDRLEISGIALLGGAVEMRPLNLTKRPVTVLRAETLTVDPALATTQTHVFSYAHKVAGNSLVVTPRADFAPAGQSLNGTQGDVAESLQQVWDSGDPRYGTSFAALSSSDGARSYTDSLDSLAGQAVGGVGISRWLASHSFIGNLNSCSSFVGDSQLLTESDCGWARMIGGHADRSSSHDTVGFTQRTVTIQAGGQKEVAPGWFLGGSLAYENSRLDGDGDTARVDGDSALAGLIVKRQAGTLLISAAADAGYGWYDSTRTITLGDTKLAAKADPDTQNAGLHARAAYEVPFQRFYLRPTLDLHAAYVRMDGYSESGAAPFNLDVDSSDKVFLAAAPTLELGTRLDLADGSTLRAFASAGAAFFADNDWQTDASFQDSSGGSFDSKLPMPDTVARVGLGLEMVTTKRITAKLQYAGDFGDDYNAHAGMIRVGYLF